MTAPKPSPEPSPALAMDLTVQTRCVLNSLTPRERELVAQRVGVEPSQLDTDDETTKSRLQLIQTRALEKLRAMKKPPEGGSPE